MAAGYAAAFALGVYGGFFSGGYVTLLTAADVALFGMTFVEAIGVTKLTNVFSSLVATLVFMWRGLIDYRLGLLLGAAMFVGALAGGRPATRLSNLWLSATRARLFKPAATFRPLGARSRGEVGRLKVRYQSSRMKP